MKTLENKVAMVTGTSTGLGKAIALELGHHRYYDKSICQTVVGR